MEIFMLIIIIFIKMGTNQSKHYEDLNANGSFYRHNQIDNKRSQQIWQDKVTAKQYKAFKVQQQFIMSQHNQQICYFRKINRTYVVGVFGIHSSQQKMCGISKQAYLLIDNVPYKMVDLQNSLNLEDSLAIMQAIICGHQILSYLFGPIETSEDMVWFTQMGIPKVWANEDLSKNEPSLTVKRKYNQDMYNNGTLTSLQQRYQKSLTSIIQTVQKYKTEKYPSQFKQTLSRSQNYDEALQNISIYCKNNKIQLQQSIKIKKYLKKQKYQIVNHPQLYRIQGQKSIKESKVLNNFIPEKNYHNRDNNSGNSVNYRGFMKEEEQLRSINKNMDSIMTEKPRTKYYCSISNDNTLQNSRVSQHKYIPQKYYNPTPIVKFKFQSSYPIEQTQPPINQIPVFSQKIKRINPPVINFQYSKTFQQNLYKPEKEDRLDLKHFQMTNKEQLSKPQIKMIQNQRQPQVSQEYITFKDINYRNYKIIANNQQNKQIQSANYLIQSYRLQDQQQSYSINHPSQPNLDVNNFGGVSSVQNTEMIIVSSEGHEAQVYNRNKYQLYLYNPSLVQKKSLKNSISNDLNRYNLQSNSNQIKVSQNQNSHHENPKIKQFIGEKSKNESLKINYYEESLQNYIQKFKSSLNRPTLNETKQIKSKNIKNQNKFSTNQYQYKDLIQKETQMQTPNKNRFWRWQKQKTIKNNKIDQKYNKYVINRSGKVINMSKGDKNNSLRQNKIQQSIKQMMYNNIKGENNQNNKLSALKPKQLFKLFNNQ